MLEEVHFYEDGKEKPLEGILYEVKSNDDFYSKDLSPEKFISSLLKGNPSEINKQLNSSSLIKGNKKWKLSKCSCLKDEYIFSSKMKESTFELAVSYSTQR